MKRYFILFLLFFCTQANAITSALMMADMVAMSAGSENSTMEHHASHHTSDMHHDHTVSSCVGPMTPNMSDHCGSEHDLKDDCDSHGGCGFCSGQYTQAVLTSTFKLSGHGRFVFDSCYRFAQDPINYPMPLRPPKH